VGGVVVQRPAARAALTSTMAMIMCGLGATVCVTVRLSRALGRSMAATRRR